MVFHTGDDFGGADTAVRIGGMLEPRGIPAEQEAPSTKI